MPSLPNAHQKQNHKYTIKEVDAILDALARYRTNAPAREWLRREWGLQVTFDTLIHYREARPTEVDQRRDTWLAELAKEPLANRRERVVELRHLLAQTVREMLKTPCPACVGQGTVLVNNGKKNGKPKLLSQICGGCRGLRWVLPPDVQADLQALQGDLRLDTLPSGLLSRLTDAQAARLQAILKQIQEEVGDHWSPRDKGQAPGDEPSRHLHLHGEAAVKAAEAFATLLATPADKMVALYEARAVRRK